MSTILVVDDVALARESVSKLLEFQGFRTMKARNGREAWAMMYHEQPDLVLLDLMMPEMDGVTFLQMLRRSTLWHDLPVVVLTAADDQQQLITRAWELGVSDLVPKSTFTFDDLLARIRQFMPAADATGSASRISASKRLEPAGGRLRRFA
jgi:CheY-like chemotaxis protein